MNYLYTLLAMISSMLLAIVIIPKLLVIATERKLFDLPDDRKTHNHPVPRIGGVSFFPCILFSMLLIIGLSAEYSPDNQMLADCSGFSLFFCGLTLLYLCGVKDDIVGLSYRYKFIVQILVSLIIVSSGIYINDLYGFMGINALAPYIGIPLTIGAIILIINAINLIDGIDGLASGLSLFALGVYGSLFILDNQWIYAAIAFSTVGVLIPFFFYNVYGSVQRQRKIFMGDSGSLSLGLILAFLAIRYACNTGSTSINIETVLVVAFSPILLPILDVMRVIFYRIKNKKHLFKPDQNHIHHKLLNMGLTKSISLVVIMFYNVCICMMNFFIIRYVNVMIVFSLDVVIWILANMLISRIIRQKLPRQTVAKNHNSVVAYSNL
ncbi:MAG: undecaprenyl/decaprenyl-phosphate alpha-N-acetylglucosaminyl 1-phosphate transferase [Tannerella sp.]|nr:undecaprenyl/decaprenyl-phosphate alpha-N-acetylglucosaminyl 1-phosphate transferase [Tannerella sp.]